MVVKAYTVDLNKPLVFQVGHLGESYQEWVHQPIVTKEGPRFFENYVVEVLWTYYVFNLGPFLYFMIIFGCISAHTSTGQLMMVNYVDQTNIIGTLTHAYLKQFLTRNDWWVIPLIWFPVVCWFESMSFRMGHDLLQIALMIVTGIFIWTLMEYTLHRFLFHINTKSYWTNTLHYLLHGCHHKHPQDGLRLVFPPAATAILLVPLWNLVKLAATPSTTPGLVGGGLFGYILYDMTHYYLHHGQPTSEVPRYLKRYHLNHHFRIQTMGFGITSSLWDRVFGTLPESKSAAKSR